jgi:hypothetical protein
LITFAEKIHLRQEVAEHHQKQQRLHRGAQQKEGELLPRHAHVAA